MSVAGDNLVLAPVQAALEQKLAAEQNSVDVTESTRAFHGRGHCHPGLERVCVDLFAPVIFITLFSDPESQSPGLPLAALLDWLRQRLPGSGFDCIAVQHRYDRERAVDVVHGHLPETNYAVERAARFELNLQARQNLGFFLDARPARDWLRCHSDGLRVLNTFAYTCAFSVAALQGNARRVTNIDMSRNALRVGERNHERNFSAAQLADNRVRYLPYELFRSVARLAKQGPYDIIVLDPPSFQPGSFVAKTDYPKLLRKLPRLLRRGGRVLALLNAPNLAPAFLQQAVAENCPDLRFEQRLSNSPDFPDTDPDRSLKMLLFTDQRPPRE